MARPSNAALAEQAVRAYLTFLEDPDSLVDQAAVDRAQGSVDRAKDPIERVKAYARLDRARQVDEGPLRVAFVKYAASWAEANDVTSGALRLFGVPDDVIEEAGLAEPPAPPARAERPRRTRPARSSKPAKNRQRAARIPLDEAADAVPEGTFTAAQYAELIDRKVGTARNYLARLIEQGVVHEVGVDPEWDMSRGGTAPTIYQAAA